MAIEDEFATRMTGDATLMAILTGGVFKSGTVGPLGITRETATGAFDANGYLEPSVLVRQRSKVPTGDVEDYTDQSTSTSQIVEIWLYEDSAGYTNIDAAMQRIYDLFQGHQLTGTFEARLANTIERARDEGSLNGASMARMDFQVISIIQ